jgi:aryl-alcohol dehydrogenase-like predicted oxidoreductase
MFQPGDRERMARMRFKVLGRTGLRVSELCLGAMTFGGSGATWKAIGGLDEKQSTEIIAKALDAGINFFDTADGYGDGESEIILGKALGSRRKGVVIATKVGFPTGPSPNDRGLSRHHIFDAVDASLRRLGTDHIDLYQAHKRDLLTPLDEAMGAMADLVRLGKVRYLGVSNFPAWEVMKANSIAAANRWSRFESVQAYYNLAARDIEREIVPLLRDQQVGLMVWSPLAGGVLTGKYSREGKPPAGARRESFDVGPVDYDRANRVLDVAREIAHTKNATIPQVILAWLLAQEAVTSVIIGAKRLSQFEDNLGAVAVELTGEDLKRLDEASALPIEYPGWFTKQFDAL